MTSDAHVLKSFVIQLLGTRKRRFTFLYRWNTRQPFVAACLEDVIKQWFKLLLTTPIDLYMTHNEIRLWAHEPGLSIPFAWLLQHERDILKWMFCRRHTLFKSIKRGKHHTFVMSECKVKPTRKDPWLDVFHRRELVRDFVILCHMQKPNVTHVLRYTLLKIIQEMMFDTKCMDPILLSIHRVLHNHCGLDMMLVYD